MEGKQELQVEKLRSSDSDTESTDQLHQHVKKDENVLKFLDSVNTYLIFMDSLSSKLRQGWLELASARHSMGSSRISSALFDLKYHHAATSVEVDHHDADSIVKQPHFTLRKWASPDNQEFSSEEAKFEEDELLHRKSSSPHQNQEKRPENNGSEGVGSPHTVDNHVQKERAKSLSMFGTLVSPKLRAAQLSFETVLETLEEIANMRSSMLCAYDQVQKEMDSSKGTDWRT